MQSALARRPDVWDSLTGASDFIDQTLTVVEVEVRKLRHDPFELLTRAVQPMLWLVIFGEVFARVRGIPTGGVDYREFMTPGILAQSSLFIAIFYGIALIWERDLGVLHKYLVSPASRAALVLGKGLSAGVRAMSQVAIIYVLALLLGLHIRFTVTSVVGVMGFILLGSAVFATFSLVVACSVKTRERFMGIGQLLTMPLFFASSALYPLDLMPRWLQALSAVNPLTYQVDALRTLMIAGSQSAHGLAFDGVLQLAVLLTLVMVGAKLYPSVIA